MLHVYRCNICGDPYIGTEKPTRCPFCGAHPEHIVEAKDWKDKNNINLSEVSRNNLTHALQLEVNNSEFYKRASMSSRDPYYQALFKALMKVEAEHAAVIVKLLKVQKPGPENVATLASDQEYLAVAHERESKAVEHYKQSAAEAVEERVREVFGAFVEIESDHVKLSEQC